MSITTYWLSYITINGRKGSRELIAKDDLDAAMKFHKLVREQKYQVLKLIQIKTVEMLNYQGVIDDTADKPVRESVPS